MSNSKKSAATHVPYIQKKNENLNVKSLNYYEEEDTDISNSATYKTTTRRYNLRKNNAREAYNLELLPDNKLADYEYTLNLKKYLSEAVEENEKLREKVKFLKDDNLVLLNEIEAKNAVIEELAEHYLHCQNFHLPAIANSVEDKIVNTHTRVGTRNKKASKSL